MKTINRKVNSLPFLFRFVRENVLLSFVFLSASVTAQVLDTVNLKIVSVSPRYKSVASKQDWRKTDSLLLELFRSSSLSDLLQFENNVFIKSYGPGGIATSAVRGGSAAQTAVLWNGFNIKNPMLGESDLSLLPVFFMDDVSLQLGGSSSLWGNSSVSGTVHLQNHSLFNSGNQISFFSSLGSFHNLSNGVKVSFSKQNRFSSTRFFHKSALNNFPFLHTENGIEVFQQNNAQTQSGVLQELGWRIKENQFLVVRFWAQQSNREIPHSAFQQLSYANQKDGIIRSTLEWSKQKGKIKSVIRQAFFSDQIFYTNTAASIRTNSRVFTSISEIEWQWNASSLHHFQWGVNNTNCNVVSDAYSEKVSQNSSALFGGFYHKSKNQRNFFNAHARLEYARRSFQPTTFNLEYLQRVFSFAQIRASVNKLYRLPTMNDLYWNPGGNPSLFPEEGYSEDLSMLLHSERKNSERSVKVELGLGAFSRQMTNWIIWLPASNGVWTPQNLLRVWSRGTETNFTLLVSGKKSRLRIHLNTQYILSTQQQSGSANDQSVGKQLIYTPLYSGSGSIQWCLSSIYFSLAKNYSGYRYISSDNHQFLTPYSLTNFSLGYRMKFRRNLADINLNLNNLFDTRYQIVSNRPMPGRNYLLNFILQFNHQKQKS